MRNLYIVLLLLIASSFKMKQDPPCSEIKLYEKASFRIGVAVNTDKLKNEEKYWKLVLSQFNSITPEKILKPIYIHPKKDQYDFSETDHLIDFCKTYKKRLHGHTLIWDESLPLWMEKFKGEKADWEALMKNHIQTVVNHCKGYITSWDVVNEAFNDDGTYKKNIWFRNIGETYIEKAFMYAYEADPSAKLFYNDYSLETNGPKLDKVLKHFSGLRSRGIKVDGIGMQMHVSVDYPAVTAINLSALSIQAQGFLVHYSELDVILSGREHLFTSKKKLFVLQKERVKQIVEGYLRLKPEYRFGITLWGVSDNDSWQTEKHPRSRPLLYDVRYKLKPAYCGFLEGLTGS